MKRSLVGLVLALGFAGNVLGDKPSVAFSEPIDGATVPKTFKVKFEVKGMKIEPAGALKEGTGHHHLIIDGGPVPHRQVVAKDATHIHYGKGETEAELTLTPGKHTLTMQFADGNHASYGPEMSATIRVTVK